MYLEENPMFMSMLDSYVQDKSFFETFSPRKHTNRKQTHADVVCMNILYTCFKDWIDGANKNNVVIQIFINYVQDYFIDFVRYGHE